MAKSARKQSIAKTFPPFKIDPTECPFREFKDNELSFEYWGLGPAATRQVQATQKPSGKPGQGHSSAPYSVVWIDEQTQPLPRSVRNILDGWVRAEDLAMDRFECEVLVFEDSAVTTPKMSVIDFQLSHAQVLLRSSFCRQVLSACFILERVESLQVEHLWENLNFSFGTEGWRAKFHIYSPGTKAGGGLQHRPTLSKNGCYLVRIYYLGAWRCVWVSDLVPVDASGAPLLPFSPLSSPSPVKGKGLPSMITSQYVHLWPLLICKALLKLAAPDMSSLEVEKPDTTEFVDDEEFSEFDIIHCLTGAFSIDYFDLDYESLWHLLTQEVKVFQWDDDDDLASSTNRTRSTKTRPDKKEKEKESGSKKGKKGETTYHGRRCSMVNVMIEDTQDKPVYLLPGITPGYPMTLIVSMVRDVPIKRPLPEPEVPLWKHYRWVDWARRHGLYEDYECPRTKFLKVNGLMKLSYAPHLLDVQSTESITHHFREEQTEKSVKRQKDLLKKSELLATVSQVKEELREWIKYEAIQPLVKYANVAHYPSMLNFTSAASNPPIRITKASLKGIDIVAPRSCPLYLEIDGPDENFLKISLNMVHPRVLTNCGVAIEEYIEKAYIILECFEWFQDTDLPHPKAFITTRGYDSVEVSFLPGRHYCRLWVHSRMHWHVALLSESSLLLGTRDAVQVASTVECDWVGKFLNFLGSSFMNWIRTSRSTFNISTIDREFFESYIPDLKWDAEKVGYDIHFLHWMFRQALQSHLSKRMILPEYNAVCVVLRKLFMDPDFGFPPKPKPPKSLRVIIENEPCECVLPEIEAAEEEENVFEQEEQEKNEYEEKASRLSLDSETMNKLLMERHDGKSHVCELATEELPCGVLKKEREKIIIRHEAATTIQACWRGTYARKCLNEPVNISVDILRLLMENAFGAFEPLQRLMNEFFLMFPGAKHAYSISDALGGVYGLYQHTGVSVVTRKCKWVPYFQGVFFCHSPVKVHFDVHSNVIENDTFKIYDNDTGEELPQAYNAHITFHILPNFLGYTVIGHGFLNKCLDYQIDVTWQLTVLTSIENAFHICDNDEEKCTVYPLTSASKLHIEEMYLPNRRNILGGLQISVTRVESVTFRAATTMPNLEITAILRTTNLEGEVEEVARCHGKGEIFWPYIRLKPHNILSNINKSFHSTGNVPSQMQSLGRSRSFARPNRGRKQNPLTRSITKLALNGAPLEPKTYSIEVTAPDGWALPLYQWKRIQEEIGIIGMPKIEVLTPPKVKVGKEKAGGSAKDKKKEEEKTKEERPSLFVIHHPLPGDAYTELECSTTLEGGASAKRDDNRDTLLGNVLKSWEVKDPGRNERGAELREAFRDEFLVPPPVPPQTDTTSDMPCEDLFDEELGDELNALTSVQGPSPATDNELIEMSMEAEEELLYTSMPDTLRDKFIPLHFVPLSMKEQSGEKSVVMTPEILKAAQVERNARLEAGLLRMQELQRYNLAGVLGEQKRRLQLLSKLDVDHLWNPELDTVMEQRDEAIGREVLERQLSAAKKKLEAKTQTTGKMDFKRGRK